MTTPPPDIASAIHRAARVTGVSADYLTRTAFRESSFDPSAKASTSSASGLFQFIESTWLDTLDKHGGALGLKPEGGAQTNAEATLAMRFDPYAAALMAGALASDNAAVLERAIGRKPNAGELYTAHVLGATGAGQLIDAAARDPHQSAADLFPKAAAANRGLFYGQEGAVSVAALLDRLTAAPDVSATAAPAFAGSAGSGPVAVGAPRWDQTPTILSAAVVAALAKLEAPTGAGAETETRADDDTDRSARRV